tara:strand:- start:1629 stop:1781 length:153 start_codon:yes stop_codon:yes gene_type:complete
MKIYFKKLLNLSLAGMVMFGIPYYYGEIGWVLFCWIPAAFILDYLGEKYE